MQGTRLPDGEFFERQSAGTLKPGDYGRESIAKKRNGGEITEWDWFVVCPNGARSALWVNEDDSNGNRHVITEHEDGTISVGGSILGRHVPSEHIGGVGPITAEGWHGWLEHGVWREC
jgi:hypothetical protein